MDRIPVIEVGVGNQKKVVTPALLTGLDPDGNLVAIRANSSGQLLTSGSSGGGESDGPPIQIQEGEGIETDASLGKSFFYLAPGNFTLQNPQNPTDGKKIQWSINNENENSIDMTLGDRFVKTSDSTLTFPYSIAAHTRVIIGAEYSERYNHWLLFAFVPNNPATV